MKFVPLGDQVLVNVIPQEKELDGIELAGISKDGMKVGAVLSVGGKVEEVKERDTVMFGPYAGLEITILGVPFLVLHEKEIKGKLV